MVRLRDTWVEVNIDDLVSNFTSARRIISPKTRIAAVLKANAYGHGAVKVAEALIEKGVDLIAVACLPEAIEIRRSFNKVPILVMGYTSDEYLLEAVKNNITLTIFSLKQAQVIGNIAEDIKTTARVHIKIDTGFNRLGMKPDSGTRDIIAAIAKIKGILVEGIFTHLALVNKESDKKQFDIFMDVIRELEKASIYIPIKHVCDSIGMVRYPEYHLDMVRAGAFLYGVRPSGYDDPSVELKMPLTFKSKIAQIKEIEKGEGVGYDFSFVAKEKSIIGTLPVGYADGYPRCLSNIGQVSVRGKRALVIGKICMDQCMIDLTKVPEAREGDEVVLLGGDRGNFIPILEVAENAGTNRNEILSIISRRVPRVYIKNNKIVDIVDYILD